MKSAFAAIVGRPSTGKSTLLNTLCGQKISITADSPQTTRNKIRGIITETPGQIVFLDTPGFHLSDKKFNQYMSGLVLQSLDEVDLILYLLDATRPPGLEEQKLMEMLQPFSKVLIPVINKIDMPNARTEEVIKTLAEHELFQNQKGEDNAPENLFYLISAKENRGIDTLKDRIYDIAPEGEPFYPGEYYTDQTPEFRISELIREKAVRLTHEEIPHATYVEIADMEQRHGPEGPMWVRAFIMVERESQKGIMVGKKGSNIKSIRVQSEKDLKEIFPYPVKLDLRVKVNPKWRRKDKLLRKLVQ